MSRRTRLNKNQSDITGRRPLRADLAADTNRDRVSVSDVVKVMDARAFGALLLLFALPNVLPMPPGTSGILGLPLVYLSAQMMLGQSPWLPRFIASRSVARGDFAGLVARASPLLAARNGC
ncbi:hypothetical protein C5F48_23620, partial [Cereibacter changlensis JA139]